MNPGAGPRQNLQKMQDSERTARRPGYDGIQQRKLTAPAASPLKARGPERRTLMKIRAAVQADLPKLLEIYNYEVKNGVATFDTEPLTLEERQPWFDAHNVANHPLIVAEIGGVPAGYASLSAFNPKDAYASTVELSVYVDPERRGQGIGRAMTEALLETARQDPRTHRVISLITGSNEASISLHKKLGFRYVGTITEAGYKFGKPLDVGFWELAV